MATLTLRDAAGETRPLILRPGINRFGRIGGNDFCLPHSTVSSCHCEIELRGDRLFVRDLGSTNGTFVDDQRIQEAELRTGQRLRLGEVEMLVESAETAVAIPVFQKPVPPPVVKAAAGFLACIHHEAARAMWQCTRCRHYFCDPCIHRLRRRGGKMLFLCPDCSFPCDLLAEFAKGRKKSWLGAIRDKVKNSFSQTRKI